METYTYSNADGMAALGAVGYGFGALAGFLAVLLIVVGVMQILVVVGRATTLNKLGQHWWAAIIPFWSDYEMCVGARMEKALTIVIPVVGLAVPVFTALDLDEVATVVSLAFLVFSWVEAYHVAKAFGHGAGFTVGLALLPFVFWMMLGLNAEKPFVNADTDVKAIDAGDAPAASADDAEGAEKSPVVNDDGSRRNFG